MITLINSDLSDLIVVPYITDKNRNYNKSYSLLNVKFRLKINNILTVHDIL